MALLDATRPSIANACVEAMSLRRCRHQWSLPAGSYVGRCEACGCLGLFTAESLAMLRLIAPPPPKC
jgi:hypothetical protein